MSSEFDALFPVAPIIFGGPYPTQPLPVPPNSSDYPLKTRKTNLRRDKLLSLYREESGDMMSGSQEDISKFGLDEKEASQRLTTRKSNKIFFNLDDGHISSAEAIKALTLANAPAPINTNGNASGSSSSLLNSPTASTATNTNASTATTSTTISPSTSPPAIPPTGSLSSLPSLVSLASLANEFQEKIMKPSLSKQLSNEEHPEKVMKSSMSKSSLNSVSKSISFNSEKELEDFIMGRETESEGSEGDPNSPNHSRRGSRLSVVSEHSSSPTREEPPTPSSSISTASSTKTTQSGASATTGKAKGKKDATEPPVLEGVLAIEKEVGKWKERVWSITGTTFGYYRKRSTLLRTVRFTGVVDVRDIHEVYHDNSCFILDENCFAVRTNKKKTLFFKANTKAEMVTWMATLARQKNLTSH